MRKEPFARRSSTRSGAVEADFWNGIAALGPRSEMDQRGRRYLRRFEVRLEWILDGGDSARRPTNVLEDRSSQRL
jgi:hypothetical protein